MILWSVAGTLIGLAYYNQSIAKLGLPEVEAISNMLTILVMGAIWGTLFGPLASFPRTNWVAHTAAASILLFSAMLGHRFAVPLFGMHVNGYLSMFAIWLAIALLIGLLGSWVDHRRTSAR